MNKTMNEIRVHFSNGADIRCALGTRVDELAVHLGPLSEKIAAVKINNKIMPLSTRLDINASIEPVLLDAPDGAMIYRRSLAFLLAKAARLIFNDRNLFVGHSLGNSYYYTFAKEKKPSDDEITALEAEDGEFLDGEMSAAVRAMSAVLREESRGEAGRTRKKKPARSALGQLELF
jgi:uridine kinase